jgi:hypothetical protein
MNHRPKAAFHQHPEAPGSDGVAVRPTDDRRSSSIPIEETTHGEEAPAGRGAPAWRGTR